MIKIKNNQTMENTETMENKKKEKKETSVLSFITEQKNKIKNNLITGVKKYYKLIILITITIILIFCVHKINSPNYTFNKTIGGAANNAAKTATPSTATPSTTTSSTTTPKTETTSSNTAKTATALSSLTSKTSTTSTSTSKKTETPKPKSTPTPSSSGSPKGCLDGPFNGSIDIMYKVFDYTFFIYLIIIMIIIVPSMPIFLYMAVIYFILTNLFSLLQKM
jgi:hypothetical protein